MSNQKITLPLALLELAWRNLLFDSHNLKLTDGTKIQIINPGVPSHAGGAEFCNATIHYPERDIMYHGNIKINVNSSDWRSEGTINDPMMSAVMLHVVFQADTTLIRGDYSINTLVIKLPENIIHKFELLTSFGNGDGSCARFMLDMQPLLRQDIMARLVSDRLQRKSDEINSIYQSVNQNMNECSYIALMKAFGYGNQKIAMEKLARTIPYMYIYPNRDSQTLLEAVLLGCSGYLDVKAPDDYTSKLIDLWTSFRQNYKLLPPALNWAAGIKHRPTSLPANHIVRAASVLHKLNSVLEQTIEPRDVMELITLLDADVDQYWYSHSAPCLNSKLTAPNMSLDKKHLLLINYWIPFLNFYGSTKGFDDMRERALDLYFKIPAEQNFKVNAWTTHGMKLTSSFDSQALIQIHDAYCSLKLCAQCPLGAYQLKSAL